LFVILHAYVLIQVVLLARTGLAYNEAVDRNIASASDRAVIRQRLANTLFAQLFAGSPREREGLLGMLLRTMAQLTLAAAPLVLLLFFQQTFLPYHSHFITWTHRALVAADMFLVLVFWRNILNPGRDITWRNALSWGDVPTIVMLLSIITTLSFPGEIHLNWVPIGGNKGSTANSYCDRYIPYLAVFDRLDLPYGHFVDEEKIQKIENTTKSKRASAV
jgi:hypothetical protein